MGPLGAAKIAMIDDKLVANPTLSEIKRFKFRTCSSWN